MANVLNITAANDKQRIRLRGADVSVVFDTAVSAGFSVRFFTTNTDTFVFKTTTATLIDLTGAPVTQFNFGGHSGLYIEMSYDPSVQTWYITSNNVTALSSGTPAFHVQELSSNPTWPVLDASVADAFFVTLEGPNNPVTILPIINPVYGKEYRVYLLQGGTGGWRANFSTKLKFPSAKIPALSVSSGCIDMLKITPFAAGYQLCEFSGNYATAPIAAIGGVLYDTMAAAVAGAVDGDCIKILRSGNLGEAIAAIYTPATPDIGLAFVGRAGVMPKLSADSTVHLAFGKAILDPETGTNYFRDFQIDGAAINPDSNGGAIRINPDTRYVQMDNMLITNNENGVITSQPNIPVPVDTYSLVIQDCTFDSNGQSSTSSGQGFSHGVYMQEGQRVYVLRSKFINSHYGHNFKNRSNQALFDRCLFQNAVNARELDSPNGGFIHAVNCYFRKPANAAQSQLIGIGQEGIIDRPQQYIFRNCLFENLRDSNYQLSWLTQMNSNITVYFIDCVFLCNAAASSTNNCFIVGPMQLVYTGGHLGPDDYNGPAGVTPKMAMPNANNSALYTILPDNQQPAIINGADPTLTLFPATGSTPTNTFAPHPQIVSVQTTATRPYPDVPGDTSGVPDTTPPVVSLLASTNTVSVSSVLSLEATASDDTYVKKVEFYRDGVLFASKTAAPWTVTQNITYTSNGNHVYTARAYDSANNVTLSTGVNVSVNVANPATIESLTLDPSITSAATTAMNGAVSGPTKKGKRLAVAQAIVNALNPTHVLNIYRDGVNIITASFAGAMEIINDGADYAGNDATVGDIAVGLGTMSSGSAIAAGDINTGTWTFIIAGGSGGQTTISGTVGKAGSGANIQLSSSPFQGQVFDSVVIFTIDRSVDGLTA